MEPLEEPVRKISLNVFEADYQELQRMYGVGQVGEIIRELMREHIKERKGEYSR